MEFQA